MGGGWDRRRVLVPTRRLLVRRGGCCTPRCRRLEGYLQGRFARLRPASPAGLRPASPAGLSYPQVAGRVMVERHVHEGLAE